MKIPKSIITCDMEGRIETFNRAAEQLFRYSADEVIGHKRVSAFSPGLVVLGHVNTWLKTAREEGEYRSRTVFVDKHNQPFAAEIRITPTFRNGQQIGYCGITTPLPDVAPEDAMPSIRLFTRIFSWLVIARAPFLTASLVPVFIAAAWVVATRPDYGFEWGLFFLTVIGATALHIAANTFNDYFDWRSGADKLNNQYFLPFTGGSRSIELGLIHEKQLLRLAIIASLIASLTGIALFAVRGMPIIAFGLFGLFSAIFYTAPPLRLVARRGLGELLIGLNFGPLMVSGTTFVLLGELTLMDFIVGIPIGLITTAILWINEFPDTPSDIAAGKIHMVAWIGQKNARWGYLALMVLAFGIVGIGVITSHIPAGALAVMLALPLAIRAVYILMKYYTERSLVRANSATIQLHVLFGVLMALGMIII